MVEQYNLSQSSGHLQLMHLVFESYKQVIWCEYSRVRMFQRTSDPMNKSSWECKLNALSYSRQPVLPVTKVFYAELLLPGAKVCRSEKSVPVPIL